MTMTLNDTSFHVSSTAQGGVVGAGTRLDLVQRGSRVLGRYQGGAIRHGCLVGTVAGETLRFTYAQTESDGHVHGGRSECELSVLPDGRIRIQEHFTWTTRAGRGTNVFDQIITSSPSEPAADP
jgi:hypothetical protein